MFYQVKIKTPLGPMIAKADEEALHYLDFAEDGAIDERSNALLKQLKGELESYFNGTLKKFTLPLALNGTPFQKKVWKELLQIPTGTSISYLDLATAIGKPSACRAVAGANAKNRIAIMIPCHRVINANNALGGYAGGVHRKKWLLEHEKKFI